MPPVKPRKQDNVAQDIENKPKFSGTKRIKNENQKNKREKDNAPKTQDAPEVNLYYYFLNVFPSVILL